MGEQGWALWGDWTAAGCPLQGSLDVQHAEFSTSALCHGLLTMHGQRGAPTGRTLGREVAWHGCALCRWSAVAAQKVSLDSETEYMLPRALLMFCCNPERL